MLEYSSNGRWARAILYRSDPNLVLVFVEDEGKENFYDKIMDRIFRDTPVSVRTKVLGLGGKRQVVTEFESWRTRRALSRTFFLIDGDFDELLGRAQPTHRHFYQLRQYDIESFLLEEDPFCEIAEEQNPSRPATHYRDLFQFESWMSDVLDATMRWIACIAVLRDLNVRVPGYSLSLDRFFKRRALLPDPALIESGISDVGSSQHAVTPDEFDARVAQMLQRMGATNRERKRWVSGKHCLLPLGNRLLGRHVKQIPGLDSLCFRLAKKCAFQDLADLRNRILAIS